MRDSLVASGFDAPGIVVTATVTENAPKHVDDFPMTVPPRVLYVGQLTEIKGLPVLLAALSSLDPTVVIDVAGTGPLEPRLREDIARRGLEPRVRFHGVVPKHRISALMRAAVCVVVPSRYPEPFGLVGPEAMAAARPVIGSEIGGIPEWLDNGINGYLVQPNDPMDLARQINALVADRGMARMMGLAARRLWEQRFHPKLHVATLIATYDRAIRGFQAGGADC
jgi:glycosyltransferase involved in cell wall biosynthesis